MKTEKIGEMVFFHRKKSGLSRNELAKIAGVGKTVIYDIEHGISIEPTELGKHIAVLRALKLSKIFPDDKIEGYAFGDSESDKKMKITKDITFIKIKSNPQFVQEVEKLLNKN